MQHPWTLGSIVTLALGGWLGCTMPAQSGLGPGAGEPGAGEPGASGAGDQATAICQHLAACGLAQDLDACVREMAGYDPEATRSLTSRSCDELAELQAGGAGGGGGGGACASRGANDCGAGQMCCGPSGGAAAAGVPGTCVAIATCTGPWR